MSFLDELRNPLPSRNDPYFREGIDEINNGYEDDEAGYDDNDDITTPVENDDVNDDMEKPENGLELNPDEDAEADSIINIAATPIILKDVLSQDEVNEFAESSEFDIAVDEGFAMEAFRSNFMVDNSLFMEAKFYQKNMVRFTKQARTNQLFEVCVQAIARAKRDPVYFKLAKVQGMRRRLKAVLRQRYKQPAMKKAKEYVMRLRRSKSPTIANAAKQIADK